MSSDPPSEDLDIAYAILEEISERTQTPISQLPPLYKVVDAETLNQLYSESPGGIAVVFEYSGYEICVDQNREVYLSEDAQLLEELSN